MNVFEDLVLELKEENLLEDTIVDVDSAIDTTDEPNVKAAEPVDEVLVDEPHDEPQPPEILEESELQVLPNDPPPAAPKKPKHGREFFNKRAVAEVSSLQMVEHVLTGVEREYLKIVPKAFDDFNAKKALNTFLQIPDNSNSEEHKRAEFELMQETESWASALGERDRNVPVSSLRQYCENSRPALSSQALLALGRFYRNSPYSESVRAKFDFVITRLFSRADDDDRRSLLFDREEMLGHITTLYADWSSVPLYTADSDESNVLLTALSFEDLANEADSASSFDELIKNDFFGRLRLFKESISELFYAPQVTAAAIECNIRIGNSYVALIEREHAKMDAESIHAKYGDLSDQDVSDAAGWTLDVAEIIRAHAQSVRAEKPEPEFTEPVVERERPAAVKAPQPRDEEPLSLTSKLVHQAKTINRWILVPSIVMVLACAGLGVWANFYAEETVSTQGVRGFPIEGTPLADHLKAAKVSGDTFYGLLKESWDVLPKEKRNEFVQRVLTVAREQGCKQVNLTAKDGKPAAYASAARIDINMP